MTSADEAQSARKREGGAEAALALGNRLLKEGRVAEAVVAFRDAIGQAPRFQAAHYNLGVALRRARDWRSAALAFREAARLDARDFDAMQNLVATLGDAVRAGEQPFPRARAPREGAGEPFSIVVCSVDRSRFARMRESFSAALAGRAHEFIVIDDASSLAEGYMRGLRQCRHERVVLAHDDIEIDADGAFDVMEQALEAQDVVGLAGSRVANGPAVMWAGHPHLHGWVAYPVAGASAFDATIFSHESGLLGGMQTLDGMLLATRRELALDVGFDAATFDGFHFYDLDFTYRAALRGLRLAVTTEVTVVHASVGDFGDAWSHYAARFAARFPHLNAPAGPHHAYHTRLESRQSLSRFYEALRGMAQLP
ncbi:MAG TPA: glycosyltransferase [Usitatibacter sp.]|nr:glycosyltransferase [Usitatibacter sp.]